MALPCDGMDWLSALHARMTPAVSSSIGKKHSTRNSCNVMSCGVPSVAMVVNNRRFVLPLRKCIGSTGVTANSAGVALMAVRTPS